MADEVLTAEEVSTLLKVNKDTVYRLARENKLPSFRVGRRVRFYRESIQEYMKGQTQEQS